MRGRGFVFSLIRDRRGISAVEFALVAPVLIAFYFGLAEFCQGYMAQKRMGHATAMAADLTAQEDVVTPAQVSDFFAIGALIMKPYSATPLKMRLSSVTKDSLGVARVDWSQGSGMTARAVNSTMAIPADMIGNNESLVVSESTYDYDSPVDYLMPSITRFSHIYYLRPRTTDKTECPTC
jgi:Flp pilus assembly protein TadG